MSIQTARLDLVPASVESLARELEGVHLVASYLACEVAEGWPPDLYDDDAVRWSLDRLEENPDEFGWLMHYIVLRESGDQPRLLIGTCGYKGRPTISGTVEIGYGVVTEHQRRGVATEAARALVKRAFSFAAVSTVLAETLPDHVASLGVMEKLGFQLMGPGSEPGVVRYGLPRERWVDPSE